MKVMNRFFASGKVLLEQGFIDRYSDEINDLFDRIERTMHVKTDIKEGSVYLTGKWSSLLEVHDLLVEEFRNVHHLYAEENANNSTGNVQSDYCLSSIMSTSSTEFNGHDVFDASEGISKGGMSIRTTEFINKKHDEKECNKVKTECWEVIPAEYLRVNSPSGNQFDKMSSFSISGSQLEVGMRVHDIDQDDPTLERVINENSIKLETDIDIDEQTEKQTFREVKCENLEKDTDSERVENNVFKNARKRGRPKKPKPLGETFPCHQCDYVGKNKRYLRAHVLRIHCASFECKSCRKSYGYLRDLKRHIDEVHAAGRYKCKICNKLYKTKQVYEEHLENHQNGDFKPSFQCDTCRKIFSTQKNVAYHIKTIHFGMNEGTYVCVTCGKTMYDKLCFYQHCKRHTAKKPFQCPLCSKLFKTRSYLQSHSKVHETFVKSICSLCGKAFKYSRGLYEHMKNVHDGTGKTLYKYKCHLCTKQFVSNDYLERHMLVH